VSKLSLVPYELYKEFLESAKKPSILSMFQIEMIRRLAKNQPRKIIISRSMGKSTLINALKGIWDKPKEKECFVFR